MNDKAKSIKQANAGIPLIAIGQALEQLMEDQPKFEIKDGAVVHPLIAPWPGLSPEERASNEKAAAWAWYLRGGGGEPWYFAGANLERER